MPRLLNHLPRYRKHRASGQAVVSIGGRDIYLGAFGTKTSKAEYDRIVMEYLANGRRLNKVNDLVIAELIERYIEHCGVYYRKPDGTPAPENDAVRAAVRPLVRLYGSTMAVEFGPLLLESTRMEMIGRGWSRVYVNDQIDRLRRMFRWAASREMIPASIPQALATLPGLRAGKTTARETSPILPVSDEMVENTLPFLTSVVRAMVLVQRYTGARPGEICQMRIGDIDRSGQTWCYRPRTHKNLHRGHAREIYIGRKGQAVLAPFLLKLDPDAFAFSPQEAEAERREKMHAARKTPPTYGNAIGTNRKRHPKRRPGECYDTAGYGHAIRRACSLAFPVPTDVAADPVKAKAWRKENWWHIHRLRHAAATEIRKHFGVEGAQHVLGHSGADMTAIYAEKNSEVAQRIAAKIG